MGELRIEMPTVEGLRRYPPDGLWRDDDDNEACTCTPECPNPCKFNCACRACHNAYGDFLSME